MKDTLCMEKGFVLDSWLFCDMTILARPCFKGFVNEFFEKLRVSGRMRFMAFSAIHHAGFDLKVCLFKGRLLVVVAFCTQPLNGLRNEGKLF